MAAKELTKGIREENDTKHNKDDNIFISFEIFQLFTTSWMLKPPWLHKTQLAYYAW